jgi:hypothetical protein
MQQHNKHRLFLLSTLVALILALLIALSYWVIVLVSG